MDHNAVLSALLSDMGKDPGQRQTLLVHLGDYVYNGLNEFLWDMQQFNLDPQYNSIYETFAHLPFMGVLGNHEGTMPMPKEKPYSTIRTSASCSANTTPITIPTEIVSTMSFDYGPVHFVIIDTWSYEGASKEQQTIDDIQLNWLKENLRASRKPWKIAMLHTPIWDCRKGNANLQAQLTPVPKEGGVHLVLQ